ERVLAPGAKEWDASGRFPSEIVPQMAELGFMGLTTPEKYGGAGLDVLSAALVIEEVAKVCGSTALTLAAHNGLGQSHILNFGTEAQRLKYIPDLASGKK